MFIASVFGYIMAAVMAFCGIFGIVHFLLGDLESLGAAGYIHGIAIASWPLVVASALLVLLQVAAFLEKLVIYSTMAQTNIATPLAGMETPPHHQEKHHAHPSGKEPNPALTRSFFHIEPDSTPPPMELDSLAKLAHQTDYEKTMTDTPPQENSSLGVQENEVAPDPEQQAEKPPTGNKLSFFRVD